MVEVRTLPRFQIPGIMNQGGQPLIGGGVSAGVKPEELERALKLFDLDLGDLGFSRGKVVRQLWREQQ